jgi:parallel beta-helix repeat protein
MEIANGSHHNEFLNCVIEGTATTSSSNSYAVIYSKGGTNQHNTFKNNLILNGSYSIYLYGSSGNLQYNNIIENNRMMNFYYYGAYLTYQKNIQFNSNYIQNSPTSNYVYGVRLYNADFTTATKNTINLSAASSHYGMYVYYSDGNAQKQNLIANNFITLHGTGSGTWYGIYCYYSKYTNFYYNSVSLTGGSASSRTFYLGSGNHNKVINNILSNAGGGYAYYISTPAAITTSNYNDYYTIGNVFAYWNGNRTSLSALQTANGKDGQSISSDPAFLSTSDLHVGSVDLNNKAIYLAAVTTDIDGEIRNTTTPDIGADEFTPPANDAGLTNVDSPTSPVTVGTNNVLLSLRNFGVDTLVSVNIAWSINNVAQTTYSWSGSLATSNTEDSINIGSYTFTGGPNYLKAWSTNPNNQTDANNLNDTISMTLIGCVSPMHGTYTIGGTTADFLSINDAIMQLTTCGVDSHVVFNINPGTYNEQLMISPIIGAADTATVTFQSSTSDSTDVTVTYSASQTNNYVIYLNGADWVRIRNITVETTNPSGKALVLNNGATHNIVFGSIIKAMPSTSNSSAAIYSGDGVDSYNSFIYNDILNGYYGVFMKSASSTAHEVGVVFKYNNIIGYHYYGTYFYYLNNLVFDHNKLNNAATTTYGYAMYLNNVNGAIQISNNIIDVRPMSANYGIRLYYCNAYSGNHGKIYNNFVGITSGTSSSYGIYLFNSKHQDIINNNVLIKGGSNYGRVIYVSSGNGNRILNNNLIMNGPGYAYYIGTTNAITTSNNNNIYSSGSQFAYWSGSKANLAALQSASGKDGNSISVDPNYFSDYDLHVSSVNLNAAAIPVSYIANDIDGDLRNATTPDIGADEFTPQQWDAAVVGFNSPNSTYAAQGVPQTVYARIRNFGMDTITTMNVGYRYANGNAVTQTWTGLLLPGDTASVLFTTGFTTLIGTKVLTAYTMLPLDGDSSNDTLSINFAGLPLIAPSYCDDFDGQNIWATPGTQWQHGSPQGTSINTPHSAPNVWMTRLNGNYTNNANEYLLSPFFDFSNIATGSTMKFWRNNKFANNDGFSVEYSTDGGSTWITLGYIGDTLGTNWYNGQTGGNHMFTGNSSGWTQSTYNLSQFNQSTNAVQFRFHLRSNNSGTDEGAAIDDFCIELPPIPNDVGVVSIDAPIDSTQIGVSNNTVVITVKNFGTASQTSIPVNYKLGTASPVTATMTIANGLAPDSTAQFTFTQQYQSPSSDYTLCAFTSLTGDIYVNNDQTCENIKAASAALDAGISLIVAPNDTAPLWTQNEVTVRIINYGTNPLSSVDVQYFVNNNASNIETWTGTALAIGDSVDYTFTHKYNSPVGFYQLCAKTLLANDADPTNDQSCKTILADGFDKHLENGMKLWQNTPNPAQGITIINYEIPNAGQLRFELVDVLGQSVMVIEEKQQQGRHQINVNANELATGIYYYTIEFNGYKLTKKMMVTR